MNGAGTSVRSGVEEGGLGLRMFVLSPRITTTTTKTAPSGYASIRGDYRGRCTYIYRAQTHRHTHIHTYTHTDAHAQTYTHKRTYIHTHTNTRTHTHRLTYIHTHLSTILL